MKERNKQPRTKDFFFLNNAERTSNLTMHEVRQPTADVCLFLAKDTVCALSEVHLSLQHL